MRHRWSFLAAYTLAVALIIAPYLGLRPGLSGMPTLQPSQGARASLGAACVYPRRPTASPTATPVPRPVRVIRTYPINNDSDIQRQAPLEIVFNQPMDTSPGSTRFTISPSLVLEPEWPDANRLVLRGGRWQPGVVYRLRLESARGRDGGGLAKPLTLTFGQSGLGAPIPILMYHYVKTLPAEASQADRDCAVSPHTFEAQLDLLDELDAHVVSLHDVVDYLSHGEPLPPRPAVLTFDDGDVNIYDVAAPMLREHDMTATLFVITSYVGAGRYMGWDQLRELAEEGYVLGSHSHSHAVCSGLSARSAGLQLEQSREVIERRLGCKVRTFAYPYGEYTRETMGQLADCGYEAALAIGPTVYQKRSWLLAMPRIYMTYGDPLSKLEGYLAAWDYWPGGY